MKNGKMIPLKSNQRYRLDLLGYVHVNFEDLVFRIEKDLIGYDVFIRDENKMFLETSEYYYE